MRPLKLVLFSTAAALLFTAFGGASASATTLCSTNTSPCTGTIYKENTAISGKQKTATIFTNSFSNVTCQKTTFSGETTSLGGTGKPVTASIKALTFEECKTAGGNACTLTPTNTPWAGSFSANGGGNGSLLLSSSGIGNPGIHLFCEGVFNCTVKAASITLSVTGGNPVAVAAGKNLPMEEEGLGCAKENKWDVEYEVTAPKPLFVVL